MAKAMQQKANKVARAKAQVKKKIIKKKTNGKAKRTTDMNGIMKSIRSANDPVTLMIPPTLSVQAGCFPINQTVRADFDQLLNYSTMIFVTSFGGSGTVGTLVSWDAVGAGATSRVVHTLPLLATSGTAGGATSSKCSKVGIRLVNVSPNLYVSGRVYVAKLDQRIAFPNTLPSAMTGAQWNAVADSIKSLPEHMLRTFAAQEFTPGGSCYGKCIPCHVVDEVDYNNFEPHDGTETFDAFFGHVTQSPVLAPGKRPLSTTVILMDKQSQTSTNFLQNYVYNIDAQMLSRWPLNTVPGLSSKDQPPSHPAVVNAARIDAADAHARL